jgi:ribosome biogenesis protein Tsr3
MRVVKRKEEAEHFVKYYGWTMKFFKQIKKEKEMLKQMEEAPI